MLPSRGDECRESARTVTYSNLAGRVAALGASLDALAVGLGGRVGFLGVNSLAHVECWLGVPAFGRVMVDLNFRLAEPELAFMVDDCELEVLIVDRDQLEVGRALRKRCATLREIILDATDDCPTDCSPYEELLSADPLGSPGAAERVLRARADTDQVLLRGRHATRRRSRRSGHSTAHGVSGVD